MKRIVVLLLLCLPAHAEDKPVPKSIEHLVSMTLALNPELKYYEAEILAAQAAHRVAGKPDNPQLNTDFGRMRVVNLSDTDPSHTYNYGYGYAVTLAQPIEWPGRLGLRKAIANGDVKLAELGLARFRSFLAGRVRSLGYALAMQQQNAEAASEVAQRFGAVRDVLVQRDPGGAAPLLEMRIIEAATVGVQRRAGEAAVLMQKTLLELNQLMGRRADTPLVVKRADFELSKLPELNTLLAQAAQQNFDLRVRRTELEQQGLRVELAKNERRPTFTVGPTIQDQLPGGRQTLIGISVSVPLPIWKSGKENVEAAHARRIQAEAMLNAMMRDTERKITESLLILQVQRQQLGVLNPEGVQAFREAAAAADGHYRLGAVTVSSYLDMQDRYLQALEAINATKLDALYAALDLEQLLGSTQPLVRAQEEAAEKPKP